MKMERVGVFLGEDVVRGADVMDEGTVNSCVR